jgi:hypothetical protein
MRILAAVISVARLVFGVAFIAKPKLMERAWIGKQARLPGAQLLARAVGARDLALGLGSLQAVGRKDDSARPWLAAGAICDAVDLGAHLGGRPRHPAPGSQRRTRDSRRLLAAVHDRRGRNRPHRSCGAGPLEPGSVPSEAVGTT